jgi:hypothetical protein
VCIHILSNWCSEGLISITHCTFLYTYIHTYIHCMYFHQFEATNVCIHFPSSCMHKPKKNMCRIAKFLRAFPTCFTTSKHFTTNKKEKNRKIPKYMSHMFCSSKWSCNSRVISQVAVHCLECSWDSATLSAFCVMRIYTIYAKIEVYAHHIDVHLYVNFFLMMIFFLDFTPDVRA